MLKDYEHDKKIFEYYNAHFIEYEVLCCKYCKIFKMMINLYDQIDILGCV